MFSARELAALVGSGVPTPEQEAIIEGDPAGTFRIIAGAGSGKTETMSQRVLWLIANSHVEPAGVLGLTFTKKAARELSRRIRSHLEKLGASDAGVVVDEFEGPTVSTYNAFAAGLYRDHAVLLGRDPEAIVMSEASAWALTRRIVARSSLPALETWGLDPARVTTMVRRLSQRLSENPLAEGELEAFVSDFSALSDLPAGGRGQYAEVEEWVFQVSLLPTLVDLVAEVAHAKRVRGVVEFSDQIAFALELVQRFPALSQGLRERFGAVLLDEYQDTSVAQTRLLSEIFGEHPVMAVGDPHQAIYGWRGASSANLVDFETAFGPHVHAATLSTSWRNGTAVLDAANHIAGPLRELPGPQADVLKPREGANSLAPKVLFPATVLEEARAVADWFHRHLQDPRPPSAAVILRARAHQRIFVDALGDAGVPVHVLGIGGLLEDPAIADVVCTLRVLAHPHAETELLRLLTGGKWRLGVADVHALATTAKWLAKRDEHGDELEADFARTLKASVAPGDHAGLIDALFFIAGSPSQHHQRKQYSPEGLTRLADAHRVLVSLQAQRFGDVAELVVAIEVELGLDSELLANPLRTSSMAAREAFMEALTGYLAFADDDGVTGFVQWLDEAERKDNLSPRAEEPEAGCVQVLTIHGAKGLEWDLVAIPRLVEDELPTKPKGLGGWTTGGELPYDFRGDRHSLPVFSWRGSDSKKALSDIEKAFREDMRAHHLAEERRLMYVALTRAKSHLLLTGSYWAHQVSPRKPSRFLAELVDAGLLPAVDENPFPDAAPLEEERGTSSWPPDPLGSRRPVLEAAAKAVREELSEGRDERAAAHDRGLGQVAQSFLTPPLPSDDVSVPVRIPASSLERLVLNPAAFREALARPTPQKPHRAALRGTLFHRFVEERFDTAVPGPFLHEGEGNTVEDDALSLEEWKAAFAASEFASLAPLAIEAELHLPVGPHIVICKIDAVFPGARGVHIVDWKTGKAPGSDEELAAKALQLAAYRLAWSKWSATPLEQIEASFWYAEGSTLVTPSDLPGAEEFEKLILEALRF